uniref:Uncharacterized protein n=1 Tax=Hyaloperonospora arabidopsidis (strain Emoy2) TaxID=559515 RepID=M4B2F6_HYAAE
MDLYESSPQWRHCILDSSKGAPLKVLDILLKQRFSWHCIQMKAWMNVGGICLSTHQMTGIIAIWSTMRKREMIDRSSYGQVLTE